MAGGGDKAAKRGAPGKSPATPDFDALDNPNIELAPVASPQANRAAAAPGVANGPGIRTPLGGGNAPRGGAGGRAPAAQQQQAPQQQQQQQPQSPGAGALEVPRNISGPREVSQIRGLHDRSHNLPMDLAGMQAQYVMHDPAGGRGRRIVIAVFVCIILGLVASAFAFPEERRVTFGAVSKGWAALMDAVQPTRRKARRAPTVDRGPRTPSRAATKIEDSVALGRKSCAALVNARAGGVELGTAAAVKLAECRMAVDDAAGAEAAIKPIAGRINAASESRLNGVKADGTLPDALHVLLTSLLRQGKSREAGELLRNRCLQWELTNTCIGKLMVVADRRQQQSGNDGINGMFGTRGAMTGKAAARLWLAGAQLALAEGRSATADQRYTLALAMAPKEALSIRKQIYESQAVDLYQRGDMVSLKSMVGRAMGDLKKLDANAKVKLRTLGDLASASSRAKSVRSLLTREEVTFKVRSDIELVELLGPDALQAGLETEYLRILQRSTEYYSSGFRSSPIVLRRIATWEVRALISQRKYDAALSRLANYERTFGTDVTASHLRGVAYHLTSPHERYQMLAAQEFQAALRTRESWESLYGLGVALTRSSRLEQAAEVIKVLDKVVETAGQRFWADMLKTEWYLKKDKLQNAKPIIDQWRRTRPEWIAPLKLEVDYHQQAGKMDVARETELKINDLERVKRFESTAEGIATPLGAMALTRRKVE